MEVTIMDNENTTNDVTTTEENTTTVNSEAITTTNTNSIFNITFKKPYLFEGQTYEGIDISNIENLSTKDLSTADRLYTQQGNISPAAEMTTGYACIIANMVTQKPIEFFTNLPANEGIKVKTAVVNFLYN
jgi:hypothetical protein